MHIQADGDEKITVTLSPHDMTELDITYDEMDYSNVETRRVIWTVLDEAKRVLGKPINTDGRLLVQVSPADDGGCLMLFTQIPLLENNSKKRLVMKKEAEPILWQSFDCNAFLDALNVLKSRTQFTRSTEGYLYKNKYYIIIHPKPSFADKINLSLCEYGEAQEGNKGIISRLYEYGKPLFSE
ncbi:MAG: adaptor protein MecA [Clostridia bacterium]|nr:adaptor protein MecA [Clostridia bacterium]